MKCHYEVLGVQMRATDDDLKKSYRKMALQWHPDKNPDNLAEAKEQFQLIQAAYETLSDPQERAFYDRNRDSILRGKGTESTGKPETLDLFQYFSSQCFSGFNDSDKGFYTVYRQVFEKIASMDMKYMDDEEEEIVIPSFGCSDSDHEDVGQFYGYWTSYHSSMDFRWADEYDMREARGLGRWVERKVEKDNNKARVKARKEFNEEVRTLVLFVRKRDKRWLARKKIMEAKVVENARKQEESQRRRREEREHRMKDDLEKEKANLAEYEKQLEMMEGNFAEEWGESDYDDDEENEGEEGGEEAKVLEDEGEEDLLLLDDLYCVACNKSFRNEKSMENHQRSKKHKENLEALKATMSVEDRLFLDQSMNNESTGNDLPPVEKSSKRKKKKNRKNTMPEDPQAYFKDEEDESITSSKDVEKDETSIADNMENLELNPSEENDEASKAIPSANRLEETEEGVKTEEKVEVANGHMGDDGDSSDDESENTKAKPKLKGKKAKDARKKAKEGNQAAQPDNTIHRCTVCENVYTSKNKLFTHIKKAGHAALKSASEGRETKGREKKRQK